MPGQPDTGKRIISIQCRKSHFRRDTNDESPSSAKLKTITPIRKPEHAYIQKYLDLDILSFLR
jgi:hypothetical protein